MTATEALAWLCVERSLPIDVIRGPSRKREHVRLRWWLATELTSAGFNRTEIGHAMNRDHATILNGLRGGKGKRPRTPRLPDVVCSCCYRRRP